MLRYLWLSAAVVMLDQLTKVAALKYLALHAPVPVMPLLNFSLVYNRGASFGFLNEAGGWQKYLFIAIAAAAAVFIVGWLRRLMGQHLLATALALVLGGAIGNVIDRVLYGHVVDFVDFYVGAWHFWTFNVADAAISIGAVLLVFDSLRGRVRNE